MGEPRRRRPSRKLPILVGTALAAAALVFLWELARAQRLPEGPVPIVWDKEACAECRMHIGEPAFAAQLQLADGQVLSFDDPGCLFSWLAAHPQPVHEAWFHHHQEDRWLSRAEVGFVEAGPTPMGYGLGAVDRPASGAKRFEQVRDELAGRGRPGASR